MLFVWFLIVSPAYMFVMWEYGYALNGNRCGYVIQPNHFLSIFALSPFYIYKLGCCVIVYGVFIHH
jgi:hypothetical protein